VHGGARERGSSVHTWRELERQQSTVPRACRPRRSDACSSAEAAHVQPCSLTISTKEAHREALRRSLQLRHHATATGPRLPRRRRPANQPAAWLAALLGVCGADALASVCVVLRGRGGSLHECFPRLNFGGGPPNRAGVVWLLNDVWCRGVSCKCVSVVTSSRAVACGGKGHDPWPRAHKVLHALTLAQLPGEAAPARASTIPRWPRSRRRLQEPTPPQQPNQNQAANTPRAFVELRATLTHSVWRQQNTPQRNAPHAGSRAERVLVSVPPPPPIAPD
jgi:hypothetical protein